MTEHIVVTDAEFLVVWRSFKMSVSRAALIDNKLVLL